MGELSIASSSLTAVFFSLVNKCHVDERGVSVRFVMFAVVVAMVGGVLAILWSMNFYRKYKMPGPPPLPLIGSIHKLGPDLHNHLLQLCEKYSKDTGYFGIWVGTHLVTIVTGVEHIEKILKNTTLITKGTEYRFMKPWIGDGLLLSSGSKWHSRRKLLTSAFHFKVLDIFLHSFNKHSSKLVDILRGKTGIQFDIAPLITLATLDIICETAMGTELNAMENSDSEYVSAVQRISRLILLRSRSFWLWPDFIFNLTSSGKEHSECLNILHSFTKKVINEKRKIKSELLPDTEKQEKNKIALLDLLLEAEDSNELSTDDIKEEVDTFMFEGHDTTATTLSWLLYLVALHNDIQERIFNEIVEALGESLVDLTSSDLPKLKFLESVIKETLRLYPTVPGFSRSITEPLQIGEHQLPIGSTLNVFTSAVHRDPKYYKEPNKFDPDRWLQENALEKSPFAFIPFSAGMRNCIGQKFAMMEIKVVMTWLIRSFKISTNVKERDFKPTLDIVLKPKDGVLVYLEERS